MNIPKDTLPPQEEELEFYGDGSITSANAPVPGWLKWVYVIMPIWGFVWFFLFWNGSWGWFDRGYWQELQQAANTTYPYVNADAKPAQEPDSEKFK